MHPCLTTSSLWPWSPTSHHCCLHPPSQVVKERHPSQRSHPESLLRLLAGRYLVRLRARPPDKGSPWLLQQLLQPELLKVGGRGEGVGQVILVAEMEGGVGGYRAVVAWIALTAAGGGCAEVLEGCQEGNRLQEGGGGGHAYPPSTLLTLPVPSTHPPTHPTTHLPAHPSKHQNTTTLTHSLTHSPHHTPSPPPPR